MTEVSEKPQTILRIKRKRGTQPLVEALVMCHPEDKKLRMNDAKIFKFSSTQVNSDFSGILGDRIAKESVGIPGEASGSTPPRKSVKQPFDTCERRAVLAESKLREARDRRFKIISTNRIIDGVSVFDLIVDKEENVDDVSIPDLSKLRISAEQELVNEYLKGSLNQNSSADDDQDYEWDVYTFCPAVPLSGVFQNSSQIGTLFGECESWENVLVNEEYSDSDYSSEDSNCEGYFKNDYPEEEDDEGHKIFGDSDSEYSGNDASTGCSLSDDYEYC